MLITTRRCAKALQLTLAVIKPDAVAHPVILEVSESQWLLRLFNGICDCKYWLHYTVGYRHTHIH